jgi:uncharacterized protein with HEPN domain
MDDEIKKWLFDILSSIDRIERFIGTPMIYSNFENNLLLIQAVERNFEIMGEAMSRIIKNHPTIEISNKRRIVDTRNKIIHGYDEIEPQNLWNIIIMNLPTLKREVTALLNT